MNDNRGHIFQNYFDAICYLLISTIYPALTFCIQRNQTSVDLTSKLNYIITGLFFTTTFFYDFYQRYRDCNEQTATVVNILFWGRFGFCIFAIFSFLLLIVIAGNLFPDFNPIMMLFFEKLPYIAFYPLGIAFGEIGNRMYWERKGKIGKVRV